MPLFDKLKETQTDDREAHLQRYFELLGKLDSAGDPSTAEMSKLTKLMDRLGKSPEDVQVDHGKITSLRNALDTILSIERPDEAVTATAIARDKAFAERQESYKRQNELCKAATFVADEAAKVKQTYERLVREIKTARQDDALIYSVAIGEKGGTVLGD